MAIQPRCELGIGPSLGSSQVWMPLSYSSQGSSLSPVGFNWKQRDQLRSRETPNAMVSGIASDLTQRNRKHNRQEHKCIDTLSQPYPIVAGETEAQAAKYAGTCLQC